MSFSNMPMGQSAAEWLVGGTCREAGYQKPEAHKATKLGTPDAEEEIVALEPPRPGACKNQYEVPSNHGSR